MTQEEARDPDQAHVASPKPCSKPPSPVSSPQVSASDNKAASLLYTSDLSAGAKPSSRASDISPIRLVLEEDESHPNKPLVSPEEPIAVA